MGIKESVQDYHRCRPEHWGHRRSAMLPNAGPSHREDSNATAGRKNIKGIGRERLKGDRCCRLGTPKCHRIGPSKLLSSCPLNNNLNWVFGFWSICIMILMLG
ncbi:hypothetical protein M0R45_018108 [Rubus argutus]|uniref:Uncharacterized protein n=1 Tax=Rubus argutus TaxID=59490 RepID=A0AAW1X4Y6_RUBAR